MGTNQCMTRILGSASEINYMSLENKGALRSSSMLLHKVVYSENWMSCPTNLARNVGKATSILLNAIEM